MSLFSMILCGYQPEWQKNGVLRKEYVTLYSYTPENYTSSWFSEYSILKCCQSVRGMCERPEVSVLKPSGQELKKDSDV